MITIGELAGLPRIVGHVGCRDKPRFASYERADAERRRRVRVGTHRPELGPPAVYECAICGAWHCGYERRSKWHL